MLLDHKVNELAGLIAAVNRSRADISGRPPKRSRFWARTIDAARGRVVEDWHPVPNGITTVGMNYLLDTGFRLTTQAAAWYIGLISSVGYTGVAVGDTMGSHAGWAESSVYTEVTRRQWSPGAASGGAVINGTVIAFTNGASTAQIRGMFVASDNTKGGTTGTLYATAAESTDRSLASGQTHQVYYQADLTPVA